MNARRLFSWWETDLVGHEVCLYGPRSFQTKKRVQEKGEYDTLAKGNCRKHSHQTNAKRRNRRLSSKGMKQSTSQQGKENKITRKNIHGSTKEVCDVSKQKTKMHMGG